MKAINTAYIGIGSNLGDRRKNCEDAVGLIGEAPGCEVTACSEWFLTKPVGVDGQDWYVNGTASISTKMRPRDLMGLLLEIETDLGRVRKEKWGPRIIDLDILLYGNEIIDEVDLKIPHPLMHTRKFVLAPLIQIAPDLSHPILGIALAELLKEFSDDRQEVVRMKE